MTSNRATCNKHSEEQIYNKRPLSYLTHPHWEYTYFSLYTNVNASSVRNLNKHKRSLTKI